MYNKDFYPTPRAIVKKMIAPYLKRLSSQNLRILDPSAGKGNILDCLAEYGVSSSSLFAVEIEPELQVILHGKGYRLIGEDFLTFQTHLRFSFIAMNPPYSQGAKHLLRAWEISQGGDIVSLLNAETINNPYTKERKRLVKLIQDHGSFEEIGRVFMDAERKTNVESVIVRLKKPSKVCDDDFLFHGMGEDSHALGGLEGFSTREVAHRDLVKSYVSSFEQAIQAKKEALKALHKLNYYAKDFYCPSLFSTRREPALLPVISATPAKEFEEWVSNFTANAWRTVLQKTSLKRYLTSDVRRKFEERFELQTKVAFTEANIHTALEAMRQNATELIINSIDDIFLKLTQHHHENREMIEGWKTNQAWYVSDRFILPNVVEVNLSGHLAARFSGYYVQIVEDLELCLRFLSGMPMPDEKPSPSASKEEDEAPPFVSVARAIDMAGKAGQKVAESTFFELKFYKKGTAHFRWKSEWLRSEFNYLAAQRRGFPLPERMCPKTGRNAKSSSTELMAV